MIFLAYVFISMLDGAGVSALCMYIAEWRNVSKIFCIVIETSNISARAIAYRNPAIEYSEKSCGTRSLIIFIHNINLMSELIYRHNQT